MKIFLEFFFWILPWGQTWYKEIVKFQIKTVIYISVKKMQNITKGFPNKGDMF